MTKSRKKKTPLWLICVQGGGAALMLYLLGIGVLTALVLRGLVPERICFAVIGALCAASGFLAGQICVRRLPWGALLSALAPVGLFAAVLILVASCWTGAEWAGEGGGLLACALGGGLASGAFGGRKREKRRWASGKL